MRIGKLKVVIDKYADSPALSKRIALYFRYKRWYCGYKYQKRRTFESFLNGDFEKEYFAFKKANPIGTCYFYKDEIFRIVKYSDYECKIKVELTTIGYEWFKANTSDQEVLDKLQLVVWNDFERETYEGLLELYSEVSPGEYPTKYTDLIYSNTSITNWWDFEQMRTNRTDAVNISHLDTSIQAWLRSLSLEEIKLLGAYAGN